MSLRSELSSLFGDAFAAEGLDRALGEVVVSQRPELADFQCNGAMPAAKAAGRNPREIAEAVVGRIDDDELVQELSVAGPGFINITVTPDAIAHSAS